jgi:hypothetical protein
MDERMLRELELDGVARLYAREPVAQAPAEKSPRLQSPIAEPMPAATAAPRTTRTLLVDAQRPGAPPWLVVGWAESLEGHAGRLLDAMLAAVGRQRRAESSGGDAASHARLALVLGDCAHDSPLEAVSLPDPRHLLEEPAGKAAAWESLVRARRIAGG